MRLLNSLSLILGLLNISSALSDDVFGIGISLGSGYGTVSATFDNGSYVDIAKIEGGERYKAYMLGAQRDVSVPIGYCPFPDFICKHWPFGRTKADNPLRPMIRALVTAAECSLETHVRSIAVSAYDLQTIDSTVAMKDIRHILFELGIMDWQRLYHASKLMPPLLDVRGNCSSPFILPTDPWYHSDPEQLMLAIDYTRVLMTATLWTEECMATEQRRWMNVPALGKTAMESCMKASLNSTDCDAELLAGLRSILKTSLSDRIDVAFIYGEEANDAAMNHLLRQEMTEQFTNGDTIDLQRVQEFSPDPTFAASRVMAWGELGAKRIAAAGNDHNDL